MTGHRPPLVLSVFSTFGIGGPQVRFAALANHYGAGFRHAVVAMDGALGAASLLSADLDVAYPEMEVRKGAMLANVRRFRRVLRDLRPDVLVTSNWGSIEWALANLLPVVRHVHMEDGFGPEERAGQIRRRVLTRRVALRRSAVVLPSRLLLGIAADVWRLPRRNLHLIPNGIDLGRFSRPPGKAGAGRPPVIGTVAALRAEKNLARLIRSFCALPPEAAGELVIAGDGPERGGLQALAQQLGAAGRVRFLGHVSDPSGLYGQLDIFAMSSDTEQMPISLLEAMAAGLPIAATDVGDIAAMVADGNRPHIVPLEDSALAGALAALLADGSLRARLGHANRLKVEQEYGQQAMFDAYRRLLLPASPPR